MYIAEGFSIFTRLWAHHHQLIPDHFHQPKRNPKPICSHPLLPLPTSSGQQPFGEGLFAFSKLFFVTISAAVADARGQEGGPGAELEGLGLLLPSCVTSGRSLQWSPHLPSAQWGSRQCLSRVCKKEVRNYESEPQRPAHTRHTAEQNMLLLSGQKAASLVRQGRPQRLCPLLSCLWGQPGGREEGCD